MGELDEAASCYEKAISLAPDYVLAHYNLAYVRQDQVGNFFSFARVKARHRRHFLWARMDLRPWGLILSADRVVFMCGSILFVPPTIIESGGETRPLFCLFFVDVAI